MTADGAPVLDAILGRRSVGRVLPEPVPAELLETLIAAAIRAPNHRLTHPWRFVILQGEARGGVGRAHAAAVARAGDVKPDGLAKESAKLDRAPVVVVCVCRPTDDDATVVREDRDAVAAGVQNLLLAAHDCGLGAIWRTGPMVDEPEVRAALDLEAADQIVAFVYLGWPVGEAGGPRTRRPDAVHVTEWRGSAG